MKVINMQRWVLGCVMGLSVSLVQWGQASLIDIVDTTTTTATPDGTINSGTGEYAGGGSTLGINDGFGDRIGAASELFVDSSSGGLLNFGLRSGVTGFPAGGDGAVIYIDSRPGGFSATTPLTDNADNGRALVSGTGTGSGTADLTFAPGFEADFAIFVEEGFFGVFELSVGFHAFVDGTGNNTSNGDFAYFTTGLEKEIQLPLAGIGLSPGDSFDYIATLLDGSSAFRANEYQGVGTGNPFDGGNIGVAAASLKADDFISFTSSVPEPSCTILLGFGSLLLFFFRRRS